MNESKRRHFKPNLTKEVKKVNALSAPRDYEKIEPEKQLTEEETKELCLTNPQPGDYWHSLASPVFLVVGVDIEHDEISIIYPDKTGRFDIYAENVVGLAWIKNRVASQQLNAVRKHGPSLIFIGHWNGRRKFL